MLLLLHGRPATPRTCVHAGELGDQLVVSPVRDGAAVRDEWEQVPVHAPLIGDHPPGQKRAQARAFVCFCRRLPYLS